jgi:hypothetical protein
MVEAWLSILALALSVLAVAISGFSALYLQRFSDAAKLHERLSISESDLTDLADRVNHWMRRDSVRRTRDKAPEFVAPISQNPKAALYARAAAAKGMRANGVAE